MIACDVLTGMGKRLFSKFYENDVLTEEAFNRWKGDADGGVEPKFLTSVNVWLQWLANAEPEDDE